MMSQPDHHVPHAGTELYGVSRDELVADIPADMAAETLAADTATTSAPAKYNPLQRLVHRFSVLGLLGLVMVLFWLLVAFVGPLVAPYQGGALTSTEIFGRYSAAYPLGTDYLGRDMLSRILYGARYTVGLALAAAVLASVIGTFFGLLAAVSGKWVDEVLSRLFDALISIPSKVLALVVIAAFGSSIPMLTTVAALAYIPGAFRISRSLALNLMGLEYVQVARARGEGLLYIARVEVLPNMIHPMLADFGLRFVFIVLLLSGLSFLGLGVQPPNADWGSLVRENIGGLSEGAPAVLMPAVAIATLTIGMNLLIDNLRRRSRSHGDA
ncbi:peptide/nickel transport system permease protein [Paraburkholderia sp. GV068]|jgi:peptide/nickel transport system permease protein|uniref:ABC transporter permease n=1 Tax=Paraburkholderia TaxID=1822464 RepID=UPI000AFE8F73|nr:MULTISPECIES: ABC transporter permease [Paraburkholderia]MDR6470714.1 peptide/nickel transport system permease protein [Paraburkholderia graminis]MDR6475222.1 peptide/nickel transport system permease protein [Paraburkholderia graminis]PTQ92200.1 peptide/nickel transport system permease protein [Paraburkholderia sp. GV072]PUA94435.1 peptide/nickel transport system permease protein [Paraburkholderia sp. GV068]